MNIGLHACVLRTPIQKPRAYGTRSHKAYSHKTPIHTLLFFSYHSVTDKVNCVYIVFSLLRVFVVTSPTSN